MYVLYMSRMFKIMYVRRRTSEVHCYDTIAHRDIMKTLV